MPRRGGEPGPTPAETEPDREDRRCAAGTQLVDRRLRIRLDAGVGRLLDVRHVVPVAVALCDAGSATEVVEGDGEVASLGEAQRKLLVEMKEPTHVRQDHDAGGCGLVRGCEKGGEVVAVSGGEDEVVVRDGRARDPWDRRL